MRKTFLGLLLTLSLTSLCWGQEERLAEPLLEQGQLEPARQLVSDHLAGHPNSSELRLQLAVVQVLQATERYSQTMYKLGLHPSLFGSEIPFLRFPVDPNPDPMPATNAAMRGALEELSRGLAEAQTTLEEVPDSWTGRVPLRLGRFRMDFDGDGVSRPNEEIWRLIEGLNPRLYLPPEQARKFGIHADAADARWLEGYCHVLRGLIDMALAYDTERLFNHTGHLFFARVDSPYPFLRNPDPPGSDQDFINSISDIIAFIHLLDLPLLKPDRMSSALEHFRQVVALSRRSWADIEAETDNVFEWIPNARQKSAVAGWQVDQEMIARWKDFLSEMDAILAGKTLVPFWRDVPEGTGVNLAKAFQQPQRFDAVLWVQGPGAAPYLEKGNITNTDFWRMLDQAFQGNFMGFALWFN